MPTKAPTISPARAKLPKPTDRQQQQGWNYGHKWRKLRRQVLNEEPFCRICDQPANEVDHVTPLARGGTNDRANLQALCKSCHSRKTALENGPARG